MRHYTQLTQEQRYQIYALKQVDEKQEKIAIIVGVNKSTISRELERNTGQRGYRPKQAQQMSNARRYKGQRRIGSAGWSMVRELIQQEWSPEQISDWLRLRRRPNISHERIYQYLLADKADGGKLYKHLRCQKQRKKRYGAYERRGNLPNRVWIDHRPLEANHRERLGDWEADTIIGKNHQRGIITLVDRKSRYVLLRKVERRVADEVAESMVAMLDGYPVLTITSDNGREFAKHEVVSEYFKSSFFFAHPFSSWQRGTSENTNGLIRQYFPKKHDFATITENEIDLVMSRLNNRPRKCLGFRTPLEVLSNSPVALGT
jgi:transposase, IS30 family